MDEDWCRLFAGQTARAVNPDTGEAVNIRTFVVDPSNVEGLKIRFRYRTSPRESRTYRLLCWRCWTSSETIFLSGLCGESGLLHQFIVDKISDLVEIPTNVPIQNPKLHFLSIAEVSSHDIRLKRELKALRAESKKKCLLGIKVLTRISQSFEATPHYEEEIIRYYLRERLYGEDAISAKLIEELTRTAKRTAPTSSMARTAAETISKDSPHLDLVFRCAERLLTPESSGGGFIAPIDKLQRIKDLIAVKRRKA